MTLIRPQPFASHALWSLAAAWLFGAAPHAVQAANPVPSATNAPAAAAAPTCPPILRHTFARLQDDAPQNLCQYAGKVVLVVNTASFCGFTSQYEGLEALYARYQARGLVVLGFPSNDFGAQEPGSAKEIGELCFGTFGVKFPMFVKSEVVGPKRNPLYAALGTATKTAPSWNFHKYLIDREGKVLAHYPSRVTPQSAELTGALERALGK